MIDDFFSIVIIAAGIYILYAARELKQNHHIIKTVIAMPEGRTMPSDMEGLVKFMFPKLMGLALVTFLLGFDSLAESYVAFMQNNVVSDIISIAIYVIFFAYFIYFVVNSKKATKMFF